MFDFFHFPILQCFKVQHLFLTYGKTFHITGKDYVSGACHSDVVFGRNFFFLRGGAGGGEKCVVVVESTV